jgi:hypothetical protein
LAIEHGKIVTAKSKTPGIRPSNRCDMKAPKSASFQTSFSNLIVIVQPNFFFNNQQPHPESASSQTPTLA